MFYKFNGIFPGQPENLVFLWEEKKKKMKKKHVRIVAGQILERLASKE